jgi:drug/metabolite transporter (DMT)-like permease
VAAPSAEAGPARAPVADRTLGLAALLAGGACIAFAPIFVRLSDTSPAASAFWRVLLALVPLAIWFAWSQRAAASARTRPAAPLPWRTMLVAGFCFAGDLGFWHWSIAYTSVANSTLEANFAPIFVTLGAWLLFGQTVRPAFLVALAITLGGAILLIGPNFGAGGNALLGDALGVITAIWYAGYLLAVNAAAPRASTARIALVNTAVAAALLLPFAALTAEQFWPQSARGWLVLAGLALVAHAFGQSLIAFGLSRVPAALGSVMLLIQPVLAAVYAWIILGEGMVAMQIAGGAIVLVGIYLARRSS